jgi:pilus assembly protein TadC
MGRNEIRLRRQKMSSGRIAQHRNYAEVMARHERDVKLKRITRAFLYFLIIVFLLILFLIVGRWELKKNSVKPGKTSLIEAPIKKT